MSDAYRSFVHFGDAIAAFRLDGSADIFAPGDIPDAPTDHQPTLDHLATLGAPFRSTWARGVTDAELDLLRRRTATFMAGTLQHAALGAVTLLPESVFALARIVRQTLPQGGRVLASSTFWPLEDVLCADEGAPRIELAFVDDDNSAAPPRSAHRAGIFRDLPNGGAAYDAALLDTVALDGGRTGAIIRAAAAVRGGPVIVAMHRRESATYNNVPALVPLDVVAAHAEVVIRLTASFDIPSSCFDVVVFQDDVDNVPLGAVTVEDVLDAEPPLARHPWGEHIVDFSIPVDAGTLSAARALYDAAFGIAAAVTTENRGDAHFDLTTGYATEGTSVFAVHPSSGIVSVMLSHWSPARLYAACLALSAAGPRRARLLSASSAANTPPTLIPLSQN